MTFSTKKYTIFTLFSFNNTLVYRILIGFLVGWFFVGCSTSKNTTVSRAYHNTTARFNVYYYSNESINEGIFKIEQNHKENYDKILPVYIYPAPDKVKSTFPEFDKAIKKSTRCIQHHAIKDGKGVEIPSAGKWIDNNWINIGIARFYKREIFSGIEAFEYVVRTYSKSKDKYDAMLWLIRSYNEVGAVSSSAPIISLLKNQKELPRHVKRELPAAEADYFFRKGLYTEAYTKLIAATKNKHILYGVAKKKRARYSFIIAQMLEEQKDYKRAKKYYESVIRLKPNYELVFYSKIKLARMLDVKRSNSDKTKKELLKMSKEFKNSDYYDVIFYTLGEIEEKEKNIDLALTYYKKSAATSVNNMNQKALAFLKLAEINFDKTHYVLAQSYYDSTLVTLPKDHPNFENIVARQNTLINLVNCLNTIKKEDSLQHIAKMSETERLAYITKMIRKMEEDEARAKELQDKLALENANNPNANLNTNPNNNLMGDNKASFYFYNQSTISFGVSDFFKKWGNRKNEDNWRRSNKTLTIDETVNNNPKDEKDEGNKDNSVDPRKTPEFYLKYLPLTDSLMQVSHGKIIESFYLLGTTYREDLHNNPKAIATFDELNKRYAEHKYLLNTYYQLYRINEQDKRSDKAEYYKNKILSEFPESEFAQIINNPKYGDDKKVVTSEVEKKYTSVYKKFNKEKYQESYTLSSEAISQFGKSPFQPKFEYIRAISAGKLFGIDSLEFYMKNIVALYPQTEVWSLANEVLTSIKKQKNPEMFNPIKDPKVMGKDTFQINLESEHFILAIAPDDPKMVNTFKTRLGNFTKKYYSNKEFNITSTLFASKMQMVTIKTFATAKEAAQFLENLENDPEVFAGEIKKDVFQLLNMSAENLPMFYKKHNVSGYILFYNDNYKSVIPKQAN